MLLTAVAAFGLLQHAGVAPRAAVQPLARTSHLVSVAAAPVAAPRLVEPEVENLPGLSGLQGKAMLVEMEDIPSKAEVRKALPTAPSFFVAEILGPLRDFLGAHTSELELSGEAPAAGWRAAEWAAAERLFVLAHRIERRLGQRLVRVAHVVAHRRLHAKRDGSGAKEGEVADSAKIAAQLLLDVDALGAELAGLGVELKGESFGRLREAVRPDASAVAQLSGS